MEIGALSGAAGSQLSNTLNNASAVTFSLGELGENTNFFGNVTNNGTGVTAVTLTGAGSTEFSGTDSYTGALTNSSTPPTPSSALQLYQVSVGSVTHGDAGLYVNTTEAIRN